jgi:proline iminopeptidase
MALPRPFARAIAVLVFLVGLALSLVAGFVAAFQAAKATPSIGWLVTVVLGIFFVCILIVSWLTANLWRTGSKRFLWISSVGLTALLAVALFLAVLSPMHSQHLVPQVRANTQYWSLPTGSRIAYSVYEPPPGVAVKPDPIVFLHGGPGIRSADFDHAFYSQFAQDGFRVFLFDQAGSGLSDQLPRGSDYTVERFVADLEAIRQQIGAKKMILIGHSWGGTLAAHYAATYPGHVAKLVFHSPGHIWAQSFAPMEDRRTEAPAAQPIPPPRIFAAFALSYVNLNATENLISQSELGDWELANVDPRELVCKGELNKLPRDFSGATIAGMNMYPILVVTQELKQTKMDVRPQLGALHIPAIAVEGQCDFLPWSEHVQYKHSIPGLQDFYIADAGHYIHLSQQEKLAAVIRAFLLDQPPPFPPNPDDRDPRPPLPKAVGN